MDDFPTGIGGDGGEQPPSPGLIDMLRSKASYLISAGLFVVGNATGYMMGRSSAPTAPPPVAAPEVVPPPAPVVKKPAPAVKKSKKAKKPAASKKKKAKKPAPAADN